MAKKQNQKPKQGQSSSNMITNLPIKGMVKDVDSSYVDKQNWSHARNAINNSVDGDTGVIGNEPANLLCAEIPYTVIGGIHLYGDKWIIFSTDNTELGVYDKSSEIGEFDDSTCTYTSLVNDSCLELNQNHLIIGVAKENFDCGWQIYWDDGNNPSRTLPIADIPYKQYISSTLGPDGTYADQCIVYENLTPLQLDCERIRLAPLLDTPTLTLSKAQEGGQLPNGMYQVFIAYSHNDQIIGDYLGVSNAQPLWSYENNSGSLDLRITNLDKEFEFVQVVVRTRVHNGYSSYILGFYSTETLQINIDYLDPDLEKVKSSRLLLRNPAYEKSKGMFEVNDYLIRSQPVEQFDFNYQPLANNIETEWTSTQYPANYYKNGGNKPTFLRDEVYTFFIRFIYNTGEKSKSYHIPGRAAESNASCCGGAVIEDDPDTTSNNFTGTEKYFKTHNTAKYGGVLTGTTNDGGTHVSYGKMGFWESNERYNATDPVRWGALCGKKIRHHKMPTENTHITTQLSDGAWQLFGGNSASGIFVLGAQFSNIAAPLDNYGNIIENIKGYEILVGNRDGNKSIIAKGIIRNMMSYERTEHWRSLDPANWEFNNGGQALNNKIGPMAARSHDLTTAFDTPVGQSQINFGLMPNYPYNDTQTDPFLNHRGNGDIDSTTSPWFAGMLGGPAVENNWITGQGSLAGKWGNTNQSIHYSGELSTDAMSRGLNEFTRDYHTFHSPDLNFTHMYLAPSEMVVYKTLTGTQEGQFIKSEKHPGAKLLKNKAVLIAAIIGVGYALNKMRGKRNVKINTAKSQSTGETMAVGSGMTPMPGTGTAAAAVNVLLSVPGTVIGAVSEVAFNTVVDVASVFGAGKLARQIGAPIYQMIESGTTGLMAGHLGPNKSIEYVGSDFTSVPTLFSMVTGILSFLNYVAIGGDKIIDLILALVDFQDYAYKYNSHGFYSAYNPFLGGGCVDDLGTTSSDGTTTNMGTCSNDFRHQIDRARYIKQGINYFDGDIPVHNLHRPSTVVIKTNTKIDSPSNHGYIDNSKITIGGGKCAGVFNYPVGEVDNPSRTLSWWSPTGIVNTSIAAHYVGLKVDNDSQYGQLDSILFTPMSQPYRFINPIDGTIQQQSDIVPSTRFSTGPLFGGDTYINRYTEKVTMPFWYDFMKDGPDGLPFDYRFYSNIPFPRYWMDTAKYRMDEFVRPIKDLSFDFSNAYPTDMYHLDSPTLVDCAAINAEYVTTGSGGATSNYNEELNFHLQVVSVPASGNIMATLDNRSSSKTWEIAGVAKSQFITHPNENASWYAGTTVPIPVDQDGNQIFEPAREREVAAGIQARHKSHNHSTPLVDWGGSNCISSGKDDWYDFCNPGGEVSPPRKTDIDGVAQKFKALYNWNTGSFVSPVAWSTPSGVIGDPGYSGGPCHHDGYCWAGSIRLPAGTTRKECFRLNGNSFAWTAGVNEWVDSCLPQDDPRDFRYYSSKQKKKEKGWFSGTIVLDTGSFNVGGNTGVGGYSDCDGAGLTFGRPGNTNRHGNIGEDPDNRYNKTIHVLIIKGGHPPKTGDASGNGDSYDDEFDDSEYSGVADDKKKRRGGLFVETLGYMYTHVSGVNDFYVESDMNLAFREWEDVPRKRHYDNEEFTDYNLLFHADHISMDNYYKYDQSLNTRRLWSASFGIIQPSWYDPLISESCFVDYPKRLLYSLPSVGTHTKSLQQFKRDEVADHWRTFLPENFRDFKSRVNTIASTDKTGAIILFPTLSPQLFQGVDTIQMAKSTNKLVIGDGGLFSQAFQNVTNSNVSHEYGSCESSRSVTATPSGIYFVSQAQGKIFQYASKGLVAISDQGMKWWFNKYLPSQLLKDFPEAEKHSTKIDNPVLSAGVQSVYDPNNDILYFSKRDYKAHADKVDDIIINPDAKWIYQGAGSSVEIDVLDTDYFEDVSWTVSYDPKSKAWISFHDWHPELAFNSINHFLTTKKSVSATPICPPGYTYNGSTELCEIASVGSQQAAVLLDQILAENTSLSQPAYNSFAGSVPCEFDAILCLDASNSISGNANTQNMKDFATGIVDGFSASLATGDTQMGMMRFGGGEQNGAADCTAYNNNELRRLTSVEQGLTDWINCTGAYAAPNASSPGLGYHIGTGPNNEPWNGAGVVGDNPCGTDIIGGIWFALALLYGPDARAGVPKKLFVAMDGAHSNCGTQVSNYNVSSDLPFGWTVGQMLTPTPTLQLSTVSGAGFGWSTGGPDVSWFINNILNSGNYPDLEVFAIILDPSGSPSTASLLAYGNQFDNSPGNQNTYQGTFDDPQDAQDIADAIVNTSCTPPITCNCPDASWTMQPGLCDENNTPLCTKGGCACPTGVTPPYNLVGTCGASLNPTCERNVCSCAGTPGFGTAMAWETGTCDSQGDPLICHWDYADAVVANYETGGIWRHNARTDKFANFYGTDYPWEVDILETSGQQVTTLRNVEYLLESYVYKNDGRDRFHVLDFNFDEAEIYNSEQTSGLLKLDLSPKNNAPLITTYPIINANDISILYSKEEQKYRFNQFWDVTNDRGEFSGIENTIYVTRLNGYIRDLNTANINLLKSSFERKKFRHYYNHVILRRSVSDDKKMLLRLHNAKLNNSSR